MGLVSAAADSVFQNDRPITEIDRTHHRRQHADICFSTADDECGDMLA